MSLPAPPAYDDVVEGQSYCSSVRQPTAINVSAPHNFIIVL